VALNHKIDPTLVGPSFPRPILKISHGHLVNYHINIVPPSSGVKRLDLMWLLMSEIDLCFDPLNLLLLSCS